MANLLDTWRWVQGWYQGKLQSVQGALADDGLPVQQGLEDISSQEDDSNGQQGMSVSLKRCTNRMIAAV